MPAPLAQIAIQRPGRLDPERDRSVGLALGLHPPAEVSDPGEPSSGRVAGVALADLDQLPPTVLALQLGRPNLGMVLSQPAGEAPYRQLPGDGEYGEVGMTHADYIGDMERSASSPRSHDRCVRAAQEVRELASVGHRLVPVAVV
jgi:hypothetical protein